MPRLLESLEIDGPAGKLECLHEGPDEGDAIQRAAVVCHPHPLFGGTLHNKVVFRLARAARSAGSAVLRFNFRGVGASGGTHNDGFGEQDDVRAAMDFMRERYPSLPLVLAGFSFGASMSLRVACQDAGVERVVSAGTPVERGGFQFLEKCSVPRHFIQSTNDEHGSRERLEEVYAATPEPKKLTWIEADDHFFAGALDEFEAAAQAAFSEG